MAIRYWRSGDDSDGIFPAGTRGLDDDTYGGDLFLRASRGVAVAAAAASIFTASLGYGICQDREEIPAGKLHAVPEEDYWQNPTAPVTATMFQVLPYRPDPEEIPAGKLYGAPTDDYWQAPPSAPWPAFVKLFADTDDLPVAVAAFQPDEDAWQPVAAWPALSFKPVQIDPDDLPAASLFGQPDEDYWTSGVAPQPATLYQRLPVGDSDELPAGALYGQPDEDYWVSGVVPQLTSWFASLQTQQDEIALAVLAVDEDYWQAPAPAQATFFAAVFADTDDLPMAAATPFWLDEDYAYAALPLSMLAVVYQRFPCLPDPEEIPANVAGWVQPPPAQGAVSTAIFVFDD